MTACEEYLQEDVNLNGSESEFPSTPVSVFDDFLEKVSVLLVETQKKLELTEHYLQEALRINKDQSNKIVCLELETKLLRYHIENRIGRDNR